MFIELTDKQAHDMHSALVKVAVDLGQEIRRAKLSKKRTATLVARREIVRDLYCLIYNAELHSFDILAAESTAPGSASCQASTPNSVEPGQFSDNPFGSGCYLCGFGWQAGEVKVGYGTGFGNRFVHTSCYSRQNAGVTTGLNLR